MRLQPPRTLPRWAWSLAAAVLVLAGSGWLVGSDVAARREAFDTDARIAHRLLSQQAVQHDAVLATLTLLQPAADAASPSDGGPEQRLPALYPQVLKVTRRAGTGSWPAAWAAAEAESARLQRAVLAESDLDRGRYTLLRAGVGASYALLIDAAATVPGAEWPLPRGGPVRALLRHGAQQWVIQPGDTAPAAWHFEARKRLAADSQPFELVVSQALHWRALPWLPLALWWALSAAALAALAAWQRQRQATQRAQDLLRLGQVGRLNALGELAAGMAHELNQPLTAVLASTQAAQRLLGEDEPDLATVRQALAAKRTAGAPRGRRGGPPAPPGAAAGHGRRATGAGAAGGRAPGAVPAGAADRRAGRAGPVPRSARRPAGAGRPGGAGADRAQPGAQRPAGAGTCARRHAPPDAGRSARRCPGASACAGQRPRLPPAALARAFEPFFTTRDGGLGLGLSLCETLAAGMGGALAARNRPEGGAELTLTMPQAGGPAMNQTPLIQLVDDDAAVRDSLALLIGTVGLRVVPWAHPQAFMDGFDREAIGAIVLDVRMPGLGGLQVLDLLREQGVDTPVLMLTGHGTVAMCRRAFKGGAAEFLEKPVDDQALLDALQAAVRQHVRSRQRMPAGREARERFAQLSRVNARCWASSSPASPTRRSAARSCSARARWKTTAPTSLPSSGRPRWRS
jgi:FixJ family two-component response regulator